jgi:hypothetical protein
MALNNQAFQGLYDYKDQMDRAVAGLLMDSGSNVDEWSKVNSGVQMGQTIQSITVGGTIAAGNVFSVVIAVDTPIGQILSRTASYTAIAADTAAIVAGKLRDAINAEELLNDYVEASATGAVIGLTVRVNRKIKTIAATATGAATITAAPTITNATEPTQIRWGFFAAQYPGFSDNQIGAVTSNVGAKIVGVCKLFQVQDREWPYDPLREFGLQAYEAGLFLRKGRIWVPVSGVVARGDGVAYLNTTGQPCASGTANSTTVNGAEFIAASGSDGLAGLDLNLPA